MVEIITPMPSSSSLASADVESPADFDFQSQATDSQDHLDFQAMVDGDESGESAGMGERGGLFELARTVDSGKATMQSALLNASIHPDPSNVRLAVGALSKYDLQTLLLSKIANKAFQTVDRLTNLQ